MGVFRVEKNKNYTVMCNTHLRDKDLSLKAKGLLSLMLSLPDDWDYTLRGLAAINKESINTISGIVNELIEHGYIIRQQIRGNAGRFGDIDYIIFESPEKCEQYILEHEEKKDAQMEDISPCHKNCDTVETLINSGLEPCHKKPYTETRDTDSCDANKILNKQNTNITNNQSIHPKDDKEYVEFYKHMVEQVKDSIDYEALLWDRPDEIGLIDAVVDTIMDVMLMPTDSVIHVGSRDRPVSIVQIRFAKLTMEHVAYVLDCVKGTTSKIANIRAYLRTSLFNAPDSMKIYYHNWAMHDMEQGAQKRKQETNQHESIVPTVGTQGG